MSSDGKWYSAKDLAALGVRGLPRSERRIHDVARRENWPSREVKTRGGRRGVRSEYQPPADVQRRIDEIVASRTPYDSRSDAALRHAVSESPNPENAYEAMRKIRDASDLLQRLQREMSYDAPKTLTALLMELLVGEQITEIGARRLLESFARAAEAAAASEALQQESPLTGERMLPEPSAHDKEPITWPLIKWRRRSTDR